MLFSLSNSDTFLSMDSLSLIANWLTLWLVNITERRSFATRAVTGRIPPNAFKALAKVSKNDDIFYSIIRKFCASSQRDCFTEEEETQNQERYPKKRCFFNFLGRCQSALLFVFPLLALHNNASAYIVVYFFHFTVFSLVALHSLFKTGTKYKQYHWRKYWNC